MGFGPKKSLWDGSAAITGILLGLCLPAGFPLWMAFVGGAFGIAFGKLVFGGLGQNPFNPALVGRAFLQAAFPTAITTWPSSEMAWGAIRGANFAPPLLTGAPGVDVVTAATPLGLWKFEGKLTDLFGLMMGNTGGSLGETAGILILICGGYLAARRYLNWRIPVGIFATVFVFSRDPLPDQRRGLSAALLHALLRGPHAGGHVHGHRHGDLSGDQSGRLDLRRRDRR